MESKMTEKRAFISRARHLGFQNFKDQNTSNIEFEEFIDWLGFAKLTKKVRSLFSSGNLLINLKEESLLSTHIKS